MALAPAKLGEQELEILRHLASRGPATAGEVADHFGRTRGVARTTVVTMMERLRRKRYLARRRVGGVYRYSSRITEPTLLKSLLHDFVDRVLGGSLEPFAAFLTGRGKLSAEQSRRLEQIIREVQDNETRRRP
jgi:predicted transcriptional regulator